MYGSGRPKRPAPEPHFLTLTTLAAQHKQKAVAVQAAKQAPATALSDKQQKEKADDEAASKPPPFHPYYALAVNATGTLIATIGIDPTVAVLIDTQTMK